MRPFNTTSPFYLYSPGLGGYFINLSSGYEWCLELDKFLLSLSVLSVLVLTIVSALLLKVSTISSDLITAFISLFIFCSCDVPIISLVFAEKLDFLSNSVLLSAVENPRAYMAELLLAELKFLAEIYLFSTRTNDLESMLPRLLCVILLSWPDAASEAKEAA